MVIDTESALRAIAIVLENSEANKTAMSSLQSCLITAVSTFAGSMAGGPKGILSGAAIGAILAYFLKKDTYKSIVEVVQDDLSVREKEELARNVQNVFANFGIVDIAILMNMAMSNVNFQKEVLMSVTSFIDSRMLNGSTSKY